MTGLLKIREPRGVAMIVRECPNFIDLALLVVNPRLRGRGLGAEAVRRVQAVARKLGKPVQLQACADGGKQRALNRFYRRLGFTPVHNTIPNTFQWRPL